MHTVNIILVTATLVLCVINCIAQKEKRTAWFVASLGWFVALINLL